jgi:hypothetical protein
MGAIPEHLGFLFNPRLLDQTKYLEYLFIADNAMTSKHTQLFGPNPHSIKLPEQRFHRIPGVAMSHRKTPMTADFFFLPGTNLYSDNVLRDALIPGGSIDTHNAQIAFFTAAQKVFANAEAGNEESQIGYALLQLVAKGGKKVAFIRAHGFTSTESGMLSLTSDPRSNYDEVNLSAAIKDLAKSGEYGLILVDACNPDGASIDTTGVDIPVIIPMTASGITPERRAEEHEFRLYMPAA